MFLWLMLLLAAGQVQAQYLTGYGIAYMANVKGLSPGYGGGLRLSGILRKRWDIGADFNAVSTSQRTTPYTLVCQGRPCFSSWELPQQTFDTAYFMSKKRTFTFQRLSVETSYSIIQKEQFQLEAGLQLGVAIIKREDFFSELNYTTRSTWTNVLAGGFVRARWMASSRLGLLLALNPLVQVGSQCDDCVQPYEGAASFKTIQAQLGVNLKLDRLEPHPATAK